MPCPVCGHQSSPDAPECEVCGRALGPAAELLALPDELPGLELTHFERQPDAVAATLADLEATAVAPPGSAVEVEPIPVERSALPQIEDAPSAWSGEVDLDPGRVVDGGSRTAAPAADASCPFCGTPGAGAVCDSCGRRKSRYARTRAGGPLQAGKEEVVLCPGCFSRVPAGPRCGECGVPLRIVEGSA